MILFIQITYAVGHTKMLMVLVFIGLFLMGLFTVGRKQFSTSLIYKQFDFFLTVNIMQQCSLVYHSIYTGIP